MAFPKIIPCSNPIANATEIPTSENTGSVKISERKGTNAIANINIDKWAY